MHGCRPPPEGKQAPKSKSSQPVGSVQTCELSWEEVPKRPDSHWERGGGCDTKFTEFCSLPGYIGRDQVRRMRET